MEIQEANQLTTHNPGEERKALGTSGSESKTEVRTRECAEIYLTVGFTVPWPALQGYSLERITESS